MANSVSSFFQTLVAQVTEATAVLAPTWAVQDRIYWDYKPQETGAIGQTVNVPLPQDPSASVANIGSNDIAITDISFSTVPIVFDQHPSFTYAVRSFEQFNSPTIIRRIFVDAAFKAIRNYINRDICSLFTTTNFTTNSAISCTSSLVTVTKFTQGMAAMADQRVPVEDNPEDMTLAVPSAPYYALQDASSAGGAAWTQALIAGMKTAERVRDTGTMPVAFGTTIRLDQQMPTIGSVGARTFTGALYHRYAVAGVSRPLPEPDGRIVEFERAQAGNIELRIFMSYNHYPKDAYVVTIDAGYGRKVVRENMCQLFTIAE